MTDTDNGPEDAGAGTAVAGRFYGKFRGIVSDHQDPLMIGRIKAKVPDVLGDDESGWALPCAPFGGSSTGFFSLPAKGALVWIEFEQGDPDFPIWTGCFWGSVADMPPDLILPAPYKKVMLVTEGGTSITLDDTPGLGGITLKTAGGQELSLSPTGITIDNGMGGTISLVATKVAINDDALQVLF